MVKLYDLKESATVAWSQENAPLLATGTLAGVMDDTFSSESVVSIYSPFSKDTQPVFRHAVGSKFHSLDWSKPCDKYARGVLAGGLENAKIQLWDAAKILQGGGGEGALEKAAIATYEKHVGPVLRVAFNPLQSHIMGSSGCKGEIFVWDTNKGSAFAPGQAISPMGRVSCLEWNNCMSHIFGTAGDSDYASIWDLKVKREVLQLTYQGLNMSVLQWHPSQSTKLVTATDSGSEPVILTWDLRKASDPERIIRGHKKGILSLDWCKQDPALLLSSGKDDCTKLWNPLDGVEIASYPSLPSWVQQTKFAPEMPEIFVSASLSKNVVVQSLQDTSEPVSVASQSQNEDEFWTQISTTETQKPTFHVSQAPAWLKRPISASFGFGGKLVVANGKDVKIVAVAKNGEMDRSAKNLVAALNGNDYSAICKAKVESELKIEERKDWQLLNDLLDNGKDKTINQLLPAEKATNKSKTENDNDDVDVDVDADDDADDTFFAQLGSAKNVENKSKYVPTGKFSLSDEKCEFETNAINLILNNKTDDALDLCISNDKIMEALVIALNGTEAMKAKARGAYFSKFARESSFSRTLFSASTADVSDIVENAEIDESSWKNVAKAIVAFSKGTPNFEKQMKILGNRLMDSSIPNARDLAFKCYVAADALDKIAAIWLSELNAYEKFYLETPNDNGERNTSFEARFKALGEVIEKTIVFESTCNTKSTEGLEPLGEAFQEYANYLANFGHFVLAYKILEKVDESIPGIKEEKNRITKAFFKDTTEKASLRVSKSYGLNPKFNTPQQTLPRSSLSYASPAAASAATNGTANNLTNNVATNVAKSVPTPPNPYSIPSVPTQNVVPTPPAPMAVPQASARPVNRYAPKTAIESLQNPSPASVPQQSMPPPPPKKKDVGGWNDLPKGLSNTPKPVTQNLPTAYSAPSPATASPSGFSMPNAVPPPPPPGHSRTSSASTKVPPTRSVSRNPYQPKPETIEPVRVSSNAALSPLVQPAQIPPATIAPKVKNPYAPSVESTQNRYDAPAPQNGNGPVPPPVQRNAYAPPPQKQQPVAMSSPPPPPHAGPYSRQPSVYAPPPAANTYAPPAPSSMNATPPPQRNPYAPVAGPTPNAGPNVATPGHVAPPRAPVAPPPMKKQSVSLETTPLPPAPAQSMEPEPQPASLVEVSPEVLAIESILSSKLEAVKPGIPEKFQKQVVDSGKRLDILFLAMKRGDIENDTVSKLTTLTSALNSGDFASAKSALTSIGDVEGGKWLAGIKRLIGMVEATNND